MGTPHAVADVRPPPQGDASGYLVLSAIGAGAAFIPVILIYVFAGKFSEMFRDFGVQLPLTSRAVVWLSDWLRTGPGLAAVGILGIVVFGIVAVAARRRSAAVVVLLSGLLLGGLGTILVVFALLFPAVAAMESLQGGGRV